MTSDPHVGVLGAGYVGCVTAACLARRGRRITVVDTDPAKLRAISAGRSPVLEPGLNTLIAAGVAKGTLVAREPTPDVLAAIDIAIVCVSTPSMPDGSVDVRPLRRALASLADASELRTRPMTVVVRSTVAPNLLRGLWAELDGAVHARLQLVANPELLRETTAIEDFEHPPMVLFGADDADVAREVAKIFEPIDAPVRIVDIETALLVKYASNAYHALKIAFANEIGVVADAIGADALKVMEIFAEDTVLNISRVYLRPGFAFGGSCLPKDVRALVSLAHEVGQTLPLLEGTLRSNADRIEQAARSVAHTGAHRVAILGLSFKSGSDDLRESPYVLLAERLVARGIEVSIFDPDVVPSTLLGGNLEFVRHQLPDVERLLVPSIERALDGTQAIVLCKKVVDTATIRRLAGTRPVVDVERLLQRAAR